MKLTREQANTIAHALCLAADKYQSNANDLRLFASEPGKGRKALQGYEDLAKQFDAQGEEARALAARFNACESVTLEGV